MAKKVNILHYQEQPQKQRGGGGLKGIRLKNKGGLGGKLPHK